jgi:hypothetical protein
VGDRTLKRPFRTAFAWGGGILLLALGAKFAHGHGYIDKDMMLRIVIGVNGLMVVYYGNLIPKAVAPNANVRQVMRLSGWSQVSSGLVYIGVWAFAPIPLAVTIGTAAIATAMIVTLGYCFWLRSQGRAGI